MAEGIDTIAHKSTLDEKGSTIAVLGSGLKNIFPKQNAELYKNIIEKGGLVISEYTPETEAKSEYFLKRNRIVSGIALGILVVEAACRSGTSVTARLAKEQNRKIFAIPHEISNMHGIGTNLLIKKGAILATSANDIVKEFKFIKKMNETENKLEFININENKDINTNVSTDIDINLKIKQKTDDNKIVKEKINKKYIKIYEMIKEENLNIDEICKRTGKNISEISNVLFILEIQKYIKKIPGGYKCI